MALDLSRRARRIGLFGLLATVCGLTPSGCNDPEGSASRTAGGAAALKPDAGGQPRLKFAGIIFQEDEFFKLIRLGMQQAARQSNVELLQASSNEKPEKEMELVHTYIARKVDAILISPLSAKGSIAALKLARDKGIQVILFNTPVDDPNVYATCILNDIEDLGAQTGKAARKYIQEKLGGKAKIAIVAYKALLPEMSAGTIRGFMKQIADLPDVKVVAEQDAWLSEKAVTVVTDILTAHPDVNLVYSANEGGTNGAVIAVRKSGKAGRVAVFGTDANEQMLNALLNPENILQFITAERPVEIGERAVAAALKALQGGKLEKTTPLNGVPLSRDDPDGVKAYQKQLLEWIRLSAQ